MDKADLQFLRISAGGIDGIDRRRGLSLGQVIRRGSVRRWTAGGWLRERLLLNCASGSLARMEGLAAAA